MTKLKDRLNDMIGNTYLYKSRRRKILVWEMNGRLMLATDKGFLDLGDDEKAIANELDQFLPADDERSMELQVFTGGALDGIISTITGHLRDLRDPTKKIDYKRISATNATVSTLINLAKLELTLLKEKEKRSI